MTVLEVALSVVGATLFALLVIAIKGNEDLARKYKQAKADRDTWCAQARITAEHNYRLCVDLTVAQAEVEALSQPHASIHDHPAVGRIVSLIAAPDLDDRRLRVVTEDWGGGDAS